MLSNDQNKVAMLFRVFKMSEILSEASGPQRTKKAPRRKFQIFWMCHLGQSWSFFDHIYHCKIEEFMRSNAENWPLSTVKIPGYYNHGQCLTPPSR